MKGGVVEMDYRLLEWPDSQKWLEDEECIIGDDSSVFVPLDKLNQ